MSSFLSPNANGAGNGGDRQQNRSFSGQSLQGLDIEMSNTSLDDEGMPSSGQPQYPNQPFPTSVKRKRYSISNDYPANDSEISLNLPKIRRDRHPQAIPPGISQYLDNDFSALPAALKATLVSALTTKAKAQRKATAGIMACITPKPDKKPRFDIIGKISSTIDILYNVAKFLRPRDIINLYSISRDFHTTLDGNMQSTIVRIASFTCPLPAQIFPHHFYAACSMPDPAGRPRDPAYHDIFARLSATSSLALAHLPDPDPQTRLIPSLVWLMMVHSRHIRVRDILASLARKGHRLPKGTYATLMKIWLIMDLPSNADRATVIRTRKYFTRFDLYRATMFLVKLCLLMNEPLYGPDHMELLKLMLGQRGLSPLWKMLRGKQYNTYIEILQLKLRYNVAPTESQYEYGLEHDRGFCGVHVEDMGTGQLEHGGREAGDHLLRPDELVVRESARRGLAIEQHLEGMMIYGHIDVAKGLDLVPTLEELYMSDDELPEPIPDDEMDPHHVIVNHGAGNVPFGDWEWTPKLARKAKWDALTEREKQLILEDDKDEYLQSLRWEIDSEDSLATEDEDSEGSDKENSPSDKGKQVAIPSVVVQDSDDNSYTYAAQSFSPESRSSSPEYPTFNNLLLPGERQDRRVFSTDSMAFPELGSSSRVTSMASERVMTPHLGHGSLSDGVHIQDDDHPMSDISDLDMEESTILPASSLNATPHKDPPSSQAAYVYHGDEDGDDEVDEEGDEEEESEYGDDELRAQADQDYDESEFEYDWDGFMEEYEWEKEAQAGHDEGPAEDRLRQYQRRY